MSHRVTAAAEFQRTDGGWRTQVSIHERERDRLRGLDERGEWLATRDLEEVFGMSHTTAWRICRQMPHIRIGQRGLRVRKQDVIEALRDGRL